MTDIGQGDMQSGIGAILDGNYTIEERTLLDAEIRARQQQPSCAPSRSTRRWSARARRGG